MSIDWSPARHHAAQLLAEGKADEAERALQEQVTTRPDDAEAHRLLALARLDLGQLNDAQSSVDEAVRLAPSSPLVRVAEGKVLLARSLPVLATDAAELAARLDPACYEAHHLLAVCLKVSGKSAKARAELAVATRLAAGHPEYLESVRTLETFVKSRGSRGVDVPITSIPGQRGGLGALLALSESQRKRGRYWKSLVSILRVLEAEPDDPRAKRLALTAAELAFLWPVLTLAMVLVGELVLAASLYVGPDKWAGTGRSAAIAGLVLVVLVALGNLPAWQLTKVSRRRLRGLVVASRHTLAPPIALLLGIIALTLGSLGTWVPILIAALPIYWWWYPWSKERARELIAHGGRD